MGEIARNYGRIREAAARAAERAGRDPDEVRILGAAKKQPAEAVREAVEAGLRLVGENYVQEARAKIERVGPGPLWHMIGRLQTNKARQAVEVFDAVETVDRIEIGRELDRRAGGLGKVLEVMAEVNLGAEGTKSGVEHSDLFPLLEGLRDLSWLRCTGLMAIPPFSQDPDASRPHFRKLRDLARAARDLGFLASEARELSFGMSLDYEVAIEEGATIVRVGTALFGPRPG